MNQNPKTVVGQLRLLCADWNALKPYEKEFERWDLFNVPNNPATCPVEDLLTVGIEKVDEIGYFNSDREAYDWVLSQNLPSHALATRIHDLADQLRITYWGDKDRRTPPSQNPTTVQDTSRVINVETPTTVQDTSRVINVETPAGRWITLDEGCWPDDQPDEIIAELVRRETGLRTTITRTTRTTA